MKLFSALLLCFGMMACKTKTYVKHSVSFEKIGDACAREGSAVSMNSNLNGERYELQSCLDADFQKGQITSVQPNDTTVILKFERKNSKQSLYKLTIDVDAYPRYSLLILDGDTIHMKAVEP